MQYKIITVTAVFSAAKALEEFTKQVNEAIALGWEPTGGLTTVGCQCFYQAMVKRR
jgi:hypothetical protein